MRRWTAEWIALLFVLTVGRAPAFALEPVPAVSTASISVSSATSAGTFDTSPKTIEAKIHVVDASHRKLILQPPNGQEIEMDVPVGTPIHNMDSETIELAELTSSSTVHIRYHPLTVEAIDIEETDDH